jgi:hypothetical protein
MRHPNESGLLQRLQSVLTLMDMHTTLFQMWCAPHSLLSLSTVVAESRLSSSALSSSSQSATGLTSSSRLCLSSSSRSSPIRFCASSSMSLNDLPGLVISAMRAWRLAPLYRTISLVGVLNPACVFVGIRVLNCKGGIIIKVHSVIEISTAGGTAGSRPGSLTCTISDLSRL